MLFNSAHFMFFFPIVLLGYYVIPAKDRYLWLLAASYYFYMSWNPRYIVLILTSTILTYACGRCIAKTDSKNRKKIIMAICLLANLGILFYFKYINFTMKIVEAIALYFHMQLHIPTVDVLLPVGISFYTFQALSYTIDVYRGEIEPEKNILKYALFVSFFPQLVAGPIERSKNLLSQLHKLDNRFDYEQFIDGLLLMLWGYFLKLVLADRIAIFVDTVYNNYAVYTGYYLIVATLLFAIQIYCDFYGYSVIAVGAAKILGIELMENFKAPYLATSVTEFWRGWHISLTTWFKDYVYIPLGGNQKGKTRKFINKMIVFLLSGLWHGADFSYVIWGGINGIYQVIGELLTPLRMRIGQTFPINEKNPLIRCMKILVTFLLIDFSWIFFRASDLSQAMHVILNMITVHNPSILIDGSLFTCGLDAPNFYLMLLGISVLVIADYFKKKDRMLHHDIQRQNICLRILIISLSIWFICIFGIWGVGYEAANFIYFQF